jgi:hypothetical protein
MMQAVGSARLVYLAWIVGGALSLAGAITYAELGAMKPQAGGEYVYIRDSYGPLPGFSVRVDVVRPRQTRVDCDADRRASPHPGNISGAGILQSHRDQPAVRDQLWTTGQPSRGGAHHRAELHWHQAGRRLSGGVHAAEDCDHRRRRNAGVHRVQRDVAQLRNDFQRRHRRLCGIHGRADRGAVGLRRME